MIADASDQDPELAAMHSVLSVLSALEKDAQIRVHTWVGSKLGISGSAQTALIKDQKEEREPAPAAVREGTITTVAARLSVKSCRDLMVAAAAHLSLYQGKERFSRADWVACAREAKQWRVDYSVQTATGISRLLAARFVNETARDVFSVQDDELKNLEARLGS